MKHKIGIGALGLLLLGSCKNRNENELMQTGVNYPVYGGNKSGNRYSPLNQINTANVQNLQLVWTYLANQVTDTTKPVRTREIQCQPIVVNAVLYGTSADLDLFAVNAATGRQIWRFEPLKDKQKFNTNRGVVYWENGDDKRILYSAGAFLYAVDAKTGKSISSFGQGGRF
jgi:quinoprotein glucose dehydrogenase